MQEDSQHPNESFPMRPLNQPTYPRCGHPWLLRLRLSDAPYRYETRRTQCFCESNLYLVGLVDRNTSLSIKISGLRNDGALPTPLIRLSSNSYEVWSTTTEARRKAPQTSDGLHVTIFCSHGFKTDYWGLRHKNDRHPPISQPRRVMLATQNRQLLPQPRNLQPCRQTPSSMTKTMGPLKILTSRLTLCRLTARRNPRMRNSSPRR
jgi:hypothetical protein